MCHFKRHLPRDEKCENCEMCSKSINIFPTAIFNELFFKLAVEVKKLQYSSNIEYGLDT